jgi:ATP-binding cassette subfamily B protein
MPTIDQTVARRMFWRGRFRDFLHHIVVGIRRVVHPVAQQILLSHFEFESTISNKRLVGLWRMTAGFRLIYLGALLGVGVAATLRASYYLLLRYLVDDILAQGKLDHTLPLIGLGFVGLALVLGAFTFLSGRWTARAAEGITLRLRNYLFDHLQRLPFAYYDRTRTGELIQRVTSDVDALTDFLAGQAIGIGRIVLLFGISLVGMLRLDAQLALLSIAVMPLIVAASFFFYGKVSKAYKNVRKQQAKLSATLQENLSGVRVVKAFARQAYERERFERDNQEQYRCGRRFTMMYSLSWPTLDILSGIQVLVSLTAGALMTMSGTITIGTCLAYVGLVTWIVSPMRELGELMAYMSTGLVSYGRVAELIQQKRESFEGIYRPPGSIRGKIAFHNVCFEYDEDSPVLKGISFRCEPGQVVALLGSTGSGKTTLVNLLPRFYDYTSGSLTLDGIELKKYSRHFLRQQIGIVEQEPFLFSRTIRENIAYGVGRDASQEEIEDAARAAAIHDTIVAFPNGYDTLVGEKGITLSGGQRQRVAIARTLLKDPHILILDDSTSSVDTETEVEIREALERLMQGRTTLVIAHRIQSVMNADLVLVLDQGRIVQRGTHDELLAQEGIYRRVYDMQAHIEDELEKEITDVGLRV